ncbi:hypothetical protein ACHAQA_008853 [Verticillium albo-atrum]
MAVWKALALAILAWQSASAAAIRQNTTYTNPVLPGWNSDPSCVFVPEWDNTTFCSVSNFMFFPGAPIYASKDLMSWKHISHAHNRPDQVPRMISATTGQLEGLWAPTLRYYNGVFYYATSYIREDNWSPVILIFKSTNPYDNDAWSDPLIVTYPTTSPYIDPDFFIDTDGTLYVSVAGDTILQSAVDLETGKAGELYSIWTGTGGRNPEGPRVILKDEWYYLLISEEGTEVNHTVTIGRSRDVKGPYESWENNPLQTNRGTDEYLQCVGHDDVFKDADGNWWGISLGTRSGPEWEVYPMGREALLFPVTWNEGEWPVFANITGRMEGWPITFRDRSEVPGTGPWLGDPDEYDFEPGSELPRNLGFWRPPREDLFTISPEGHEGALRLTPSRINLTGDAEFTDNREGLTFIGRKQTDTVFDFTLDFDFHPIEEESEAGISVFLNQWQHIDLGIVALTDDNGVRRSFLRFRTELLGRHKYPDRWPAIIPQPPTVIREIPCSWRGKKIRLRAEAQNWTTFEFSAEPVGAAEERVQFDKVDAIIVTGASGMFVGTLLGAYATKNGGEGSEPAYVSRWRYNGIAQALSPDEYIPSSQHPVPGLP